MLFSCYTGIGDMEGTRKAAELTLKRAEMILTRDPNNSVVISYSADALASLGEGERAKARMERALLIDPDNFNLRYNYACMLCVRLKDKDAALAALTPLAGKITVAFLEFMKADPDLESLRGDPRYQTMVAEIEARLAVAKAAKRPAEVKAR
jgi:adenylate cyclase